MAPKDPKPTDKQNTAEGRQLDAKAATAAADKDAKASQAIADDITAKGYRGVKVDPRPNDDYTVAGVTGKNPPEVHDPERRQVDVATLTK